MSNGGSISEDMQHVSKRRREIDNILSRVEEQMMEVADLHAKGTLTKAPWNTWARGPAARRYAKQKRAVKSLIHRNQRKGWNGWIAMREEKRRRLVLLKAAAASFANRSLRAATNSTSGQSR